LTSLRWRGKGKVCFGLYTCTCQAIWVGCWVASFHMWFDSHAFAAWAVNRCSLFTLGVFQTWLFFDKEERYVEQNERANSLQSAVEFQRVKIIHSVSCNELNQLYNLNE